MKIKTVELTDAALDWVVADIEGDLAIYDQEDMPEKFIRMHTVGCQNYSTDGSFGQPLIEREKIGTAFINGVWVAQLRHEPDVFLATGPTALIAATRCFIVSKRGDEVEIPEELI